VEELSDEEIVGRVTFASQWLKAFRQSDLWASNAYIDQNGQTNGRDEDWDDDAGDQPFQQQADVPAVVPIGQVNYMTINTEVSAAAVSSQCPKLHIQAKEGPRGFPGAPSIVQKAWQQTWSNNGFKMAMRAAYRKRKICGLGCLWYRWDENYGFVIENVTSNRFFFDPHTTDLSLRRLRYAGVSINIPLSEAIRRYDKDGSNGYFSIDTDDGNGTNSSPGFLQKVGSWARDRLKWPGSEDQPGAANERQTCKIYIYFDHENEVHIYNDEVIHRVKNLYGGIPLLFRCLFVDPRDRILPLGMNVYASGLNQEVTWLSSIASSMAKNGGQITLFEAAKFEGPARVALENGSAQQFIAVKGSLNPQALPIHRIAAENLPAAYGPALQEAQAALGGIMGASATARGEMPAGGTATEAMLSESKSNAMQVDEEQEFEGWCTDVATAFVMCTQRFGGPVEEKDTPDAAVQLWHAFCAVLSVSVVNGSTSFSNPATELTATMQLFTTVTQSWELWMQLSAKGLVKKVPSIEMLYQDLLVAFNRTNLEEYLVDAPPPPQGPGTLPPDVVKWMQANYQTAPPDVQRQIEQAVGLKPSETGMPPEQEQPDNSLEVSQLQAKMEMLKLHAKAQEQQSDHQHDYRMKALDTASKLAVQSAKPLPPKNPPANSSKKPNS
jgi:hypothetical protein